MNRKILIQMTAPAVLIGLVLLGACLASVWAINRLQQNLALTLSKNVTSLEAAQKLEIEVRRLRYHSFVYLIDPSPERLEPMNEDHAAFEEALRTARQSVTNTEEQRLVCSAMARKRTPPEKSSSTTIDNTSQERCADNRYRLMLPATGNPREPVHASPKATFTFLPISKTISPTLNIIAIRYKTMTSIVRSNLPEPQG